MNTQELLDYLTSEIEDINDVLGTVEGYQTDYLTGALEALEGVINFIGGK